MATTLGAILRSGEEARNDGQSESFKTLEQLARIRSLLENDLSSNILDDSGPQLSEAMSRLSAICKDQRRDFDMTGEEAQLLTDDVVLVLQSLLDEVCPPSSCLTSLSRKRKRRSSLSEEAASTIPDIDDQRLVKRVRGILESTQNVVVRASSMPP
jgi:flagellar biosynthesis/type III secretory pathway chaperone